MWPLCGPLLLFLPDQERVSWARNPSLRLSTCCQPRGLPPVCELATLTVWFLHLLFPLTETPFPGFPGASSSPC